MEILKPLLLIVMLVGFYPLPVTLVLAALVRLGLGWGAARGWLVLSGALALPNAWVVLVAGKGLFAASLDPRLVGMAAGLTLAGLGAWIMALRKGGMGHFWLEPVVLTGAATYLVFAVDNWIAH